MKTLTPPLLSALFLGAASLSAQTATPAAKAPVHHTATPHTATAHKTVAPASTSACATDIPQLSPKIPALPAGTPCPKALYTLTSTPSVKLENVSPLESNSELTEFLGLGPSSFSLDYVDTRIGTGELARPHKYYTIHYTGYLIDGTKFDSSVDRGEPITIQYRSHQVIPGWDTGFDGMHIGGKRRLFIPFQLAYGPTAHGPIPARSELIFDVELISQSDTPPAPKTPPTPPATKPAAAPAAQPSAAPSAAPKPATPPTEAPKK